MEERQTKRERKAALQLWALRDILNENWVVVEEVKRAGVGVFEVDHA